MSKKQKRGSKKSTETIEDLAELAGSLNIPDDAFDGDLRDAADDAADLVYETIKKAVWLDKLQFLADHGYQLGRLRELIEEAKVTNRTAP